MYPIPLAPFSKPYISPVSIASFHIPASCSISLRTPPQVELYPLEKKPKVMENSIISVILFFNDKPQNIKADKPELPADIAVTVDAERERCLLSLKYPKKNEDKIPGMLNRASKIVAHL